MDEVSGSTIIGVCGGSGSGKTTLARELSKLFGASRCKVISFDSYYHDLSHMTAQQRALVNFDAPDSLDVPLLTSHLDGLHQGTEVAVPVYDFTTHTRSGRIDIIEPTDYIIIEGILLFSFAEVRNSLDYRVFVDCPADIRYQRRLRRDIDERGRTEESVYEQWTTTVAPMHDLHVEPYAHHADFLVTYGRPAAEMAQAVLRDLQSCRRA